MLKLVIPPADMWDEAKQEFIYVKGGVLTLEHSLVSVAKWESMYCKPFLDPYKKSKTAEETLDYIRCMTLTQNVDPLVYSLLTAQHFKQINEYIDAPMTATTFGKEQDNKPVSRKVITAEIIYYYMTALNIPFKCQKWHLNRLLTLIKVCSIKNQPPKKNSRKGLSNKYAALNKANRKRFNSKG